MQVTLFKKQEKIILAGSVSFENVDTVYQSGIKLIQAESNPCIDCSALVHTDSSALALLIAWVRFAKNRQKDLVFDNVTETVFNLSRVYGLESILPFSYRGCSQ